MRAHFRIGLVVCFFSLVGTGMASAQETEEYSVDPDHSGVSFKISHLGLSWVHGRFDDLSGHFTLDRQNPANCSFELAAKTESVDTNNRKRRRSPAQPGFFQCQAVSRHFVQKHGCASREGRF